MMLSITGGLGEDGFTVTASPEVKGKTLEVMQVAPTMQDGVKPSSFSAEEVMKPQPVNWKLDKGIPRFLSKAYEIVDDPTTDHVVHWGFGGESFVVQDAATFCNDILPRYFKHSNFSSFIRQLNIYGFRKIDCDKWEYATHEFKRGKIDHLKYIKRMTSKSKMKGVKSGKHDDTFHKYLKGLSAQISNLSQQVEVSRSIMSAFEKRVLDVEFKYKQLAYVLSKTIQNPSFTDELLERRTSTVSKHDGDGEIKTPEDETKMMRDSVEALDNELTNEVEPCEGMAAEKCMNYIHELQSLIGVDESDNGWVAYAANQLIDEKH